VKKVEKKLFFLSSQRKKKRKRKNNTKKREKKKKKKKTNLLLCSIFIPPIIIEKDFFPWIFIEKQDLIGGSKNQIIDWMLEFMTLQSIIRNKSNKKIITLLGRNKSSHIQILF
jgi:hypothetical protein